MPFTFDIQQDQWTEVHRDPEGHYHHLSVLWGSLTTGSVSIGDTIMFPSSLDIPLVGRVLGFDAYGYSFGKTLAAHEAPRHFGIAIRSPAPAAHLIVSGTAQACTQAAYEETLCALLRRDPTIFFHYRKRDPSYRRGCEECVLPLKKLPAAIPLLRELRSHPDESVVRGTTGLLRIFNANT